MSESNILHTIEKIHEALAQGESHDFVKDLENILSLDLREASQCRRFFDLPTQNILSIIQNSRIIYDSDQWGFATMKRILRQLSQVRPLDSPQLLSVCNFPHLLLSDCIDLISSVTSIPILVKLGELHNLPSPDWAFELSTKEREIQQLRSSLEKHLRDS